MFYGVEIGSNSLNVQHKGLLLHEWLLDWSLHIYSDGWAKGDSEIISEIVDDQYTFSGLPNMNPIDKANFKMF